MNVEKNFHGGEVKVKVQSVFKKKNNSDISGVRGIFTPKSPFVRPYYMKLSKSEGRFEYQKELP